MSTLRYVGRGSDSTTTGARIVMDKGGVDATYNSLKVDAAYVTSACHAATSHLASAAYAVNQDKLRAKTVDVLAADTAYVPATELSGVPGGVVPVSADALTVPANRIPSTIKVSRVPVIKDVDTVYLTDNKVMSAPTGSKQFKAASLNIPDLGYPYVPMPFAVVQGGAVGSPEPVTRSMTTSCFGQLSILDGDDVRYGWTVCDGRKVLDFHTCLPYGAAGVTPTSRAPVSGPLTLDLWLGLWGGTTYTFTPTSLTFYCLCYPGL